MHETIGFIGTGRMGEPMARALLGAGFPLRVYNRTREKAAALGAAGAELADSPAAAVEAGSIAVTMVADDAAAAAVTFGDGGLVDALGAGGVHLSMSTLAPETSRRLAEAHAERGTAYVAAPVFGRPDAAAAAKLWIVCAGPEQARARVRPLFDAMGQGVFEYGDEALTANVVKLAGNFLIASALEAMAEAFTLTEKYGVERARVAEMVASTLFDCPIYRGYGPAIAAKEERPAGFSLALGRKDVGLVLQAAADRLVPMPFAALLHARLTQGAARGRAEADWSALAVGAAEDAGV